MRLPLLAVIAVARATATPVQPEHTYLGDGSLLRYLPESGNFSIFRLDCPCPSYTSPLRSGRLPALRSHAYLGGDRLLETDPNSGAYVVYAYSRVPACAGSTERAAAAFPRVVQQGAHPDLLGTAPVYVDDDELLLYRPNGSYVLRLYDRNAGRRRPRAHYSLSALEEETRQAPAGEAWPGEAVARGVWQKGASAPPQSIAHIGGALLLGTVGSEQRWELKRLDRSRWGSDGHGSLSSSPITQLAASGDRPRGVGPAQYVGIGQHLLVYDLASATCDFQIVGSPHVEASKAVVGIDGADPPLLASGSLCKSAARAALIDARGKKC